jgi:hypothetical protein
MGASQELKGRPLIARANTTTGAIAFTAARSRDGLADKAIRRSITERTLQMGQTKDIRDAVEAELTFDPLVDGTDITVKNIVGVLSLYGIVPNYPQYLEAAAAARRVAGVANVHNHLAQPGWPVASPRSSTTSPLPADAVRRVNRRDICHVPVIEIGIGR